jgi:hypothetical protein
LGFEEADEALAFDVVGVVVEHRAPIARACEGDGQNVADVGGGAARHHDDAIRQIEGLVDVVRDHQRGAPLARQQLEQHVLELEARERIEHAERFVEQEDFGR